jgi:hypothetical protein
MVKTVAEPPLSRGALVVGSVMVAVPSNVAAEAPEAAARENDQAPATVSRAAAARVATAVCFPRLTPMSRPPRSAAARRGGIYRVFPLAN